MKIEIEYDTQTSHVMFCIYNYEPMPGLDEAYKSIEAALKKFQDANKKQPETEADIAHVRQQEPEQCKDDVHCEPKDPEPGVRFAFHSKVVGTTFREKDKPLPWDELAQGKHLCLVREKDNQYDPNAIKVFYVPHHLGYLPKQTAAELAPLIDKGRTFFAIITEITGGVKDKENRGINLAIYEDSKGV